MALFTAQYLSVHAGSLSLHRRLLGHRDTVNRFQGFLSPLRWLQLLGRYGSLHSSVSQRSRWLSFSPQTTAVTQGHSESFSRVSLTSALVTASGVAGLRWLATQYVDWTVVSMGRRGPRPSRRARWFTEGRERHAGTPGRALPFPRDPLVKSKTGPGCPFVETSGRRISFASNSVMMEKTQIYDPTERERKYSNPNSVSGEPNSALRYTPPTGITSAKTVV
nr:uncharacterized protein LOC129445443 [Misgurnus anguillicaudatus]